MITLDHLSLRLVRLKEAEPWPATEPNALSFVFVKSGTGTFSSKLLHQNVFCGDTIVLSGSLDLTLSPQQGEMVFWCFSASMEHLLPLFLSSEISQLQTVSEVFKTIRYYPAASQLATECLRMATEAPTQFNLNHRSHLVKIVAEILTDEFKAAHEQRTGYVTVDAHMIQVFERLSTDELLSLSVMDLAKRFGCSRRHLNRLFHSYFGVSVASLRMELRLLKAVSLLRDRDAKIINVAERCGFNHLGLFNICFKKRFGISPGRWRKKIDGNGSESYPADIAKLKLRPQASNNPVPSRQAKSAKGGDKAATPDAECPMLVSGLCPWSEPVGAPASGEKKRNTPSVSPPVFLGIGSVLGKKTKLPALPS